MWSTDIVNYITMIMSSKFEFFLLGSASKETKAEMKLI